MTRPRAQRPNPYVVLAAAVVLPGMGHVLIDRPKRGLRFAIFVLVGAWLTTKFAGPDANALGRHAAGLFVWALSILDAYRGARLMAANSSGETASPSISASIV